MNGDSFSVLKYYLKTSWSTRKINENSKFYVSNDLIWYSETIGKFRNNSFVCFFFLFVCFSNFYFIQESSICSNFSFACLWLTSRHFVAVICQCLLFFAEGKLLQSSSMHRVWHCTRKQTDSLSCFWSHLSETVPKHMDWRGNQPWQGGIWLSSLCYFINNKFKHRQPTLNHINELVMNYNHTHIAHSHTLSLTYFQIFFEVFEWDHPSCTTWRMTLLLLKIWLA